MCISYPVEEEPRSDNMPQLYVKCKTCEEEFWSGLSIPKSVFDKVPLENTMNRCSKGHEHNYEKTDYYYKE